MSCVDHYSILTTAFLFIILRFYKVSVSNRQVSNIEILRISIGPSLIIITFKNQQWSRCLLFKCVTFVKRFREINVYYCKEMFVSFIYIKYILILLKKQNSNSIISSFSFLFSLSKDKPVLVLAIFLITPLLKGYR